MTTDRPDSSAEGASIDVWIERWAGTDRVAFVFEGDDMSYGRLAERIRSVATGLIGAGIEPGGRVLFCGLNRIELFETLFACGRLGAVFCPLNNRLTAAELGVLIDDSDPTVVLTTDGYCDLLTEAAVAAGRSNTTIRDLDAEPFPDSATTPPPSTGSPGDPVLMVYTSGTTGTPKGAVLDQNALRYTCLNGIDHQQLNGDDRIIAPLPTFHVGGLNIQTLPTLMVGGRVLLERRFDPGRILELIRDHRPTQTLLVPAMLQAVAAHPDFASTDISCLDGIVTGSSIVPEAVMRPYFARGVPVGQVYGTTETGPTAVVLGYSEAEVRIGSCGLPAANTDLRVVDETGADVGTGIDGEIWLRGPNIASHYWNNEPATAEAFVDGWYRTGDVGHRDGDAYLYISDRLSDVIISGGENIYPTEVESVLADHPAIADVSVVGRSDARWGEVPVAVVVLATDQRLPVDELRTWCEPRLARFKQPRDLITVDQLPRTALGKVKKHELRETLQ